MLEYLDIMVTKYIAHKKYIFNEMVVPERVISSDTPDPMVGSMPALKLH